MILGFGQRDACRGHEFRFVPMRPGRIFLPLFVQIVIDGSFDGRDMDLDTSAFRFPCLQ